MLKLAQLLPVAFVALVACSSSSPEPSSAQGAPLSRWGGGPSSGGAVAPSNGVVVACGNSGDPSATCASPEHCCFTNYTASHDGYCTTGACFYGTLDCDGPEDCAAGEVCCVSALSDPEDGTYGYTASCRASACGTVPLEHELCHVGGACSDPSATCVTAAGNDPDLPRDLAVCL